MKRVLSMLLAVLFLLTALPMGALSVSAAATSGTTGQCTWTLDGTHLTISGNGAMDNYHKLPKPWGYNITEIIIEDGVTAIGDSAFSSCDSVVSVTIPDSVTIIGGWAFDHCYSLTSITIPDSVTTIGYYAFYDCNSLTDVYYSGSEADREKISIDFNNNPLLNATWHYNYTPAPEPSFDGYITNGDFETGDKTGWNLWQNTAVTADAAYTGSYGLHLQGNGSWGGMADQTFSVVPGESYVLSMWIKVNNNGINMQLRKADTYESLAGAWIDKNSCAVWTYKEWTFTATEDSVCLNIAGAGNGIVEDAYVDDVAIRQLKDPSFDGYITNGDFETGDTIGWENLWESNEVFIIEGREGGNAMHVISGEWRIVRQKVNVQPNTNYIVRGWSKDALNMTLLIKDGNDSANLAQIAFAADDFWQETFVTFNSGNNTSVYVCVMGHYTVAEGTFDDIVMTKLDDGCSHSYAFACDSVCAWCGEVSRPDASHNMTFIWGVDPTCTLEGNVEYWRCSSCGRNYFNEDGSWQVTQEEVILPATGHVYDDDFDADCNYCGEWREVEQPVVQAATIVFDAYKTQRVELTTSKQVWKQGTFTVTNNKALSTSNVADYSNPVRFYKNSEVVISFPGMTAFMVDASGLSSQYRTGLATTLTEAGLNYVDDNGVFTVRLTAPTDSITLTCAAQLRWSSITVTSLESELEDKPGSDDAGSTPDDTCQHEYAYPCDDFCLWCYHREDHSALHNIVHVEAKEPNCYENGNIEYWCCDVCGYAWLYESCMANTNLKSVILPAAHTYDNASDPDCNYCGEWREGEVLTGLLYEIVDSEVTITGYTADLPANLVIPDTIEGYPVTTIGEYAFDHCDPLMSVTIPDSVITIGDYAFYTCYFLTTVTIPDSVITIGDYAFAYCRSLKSATFGDSVATIGSYAFTLCDALVSIDLADNTTKIGSYAFSYCYSLTSVTIPVSVATIGSSAFRYSTDLTDVYYEGSVADRSAISIGSYNTPLLNAMWHYAAELGCIHDYAYPCDDFCRGCYHREDHSALHNIVHVEAVATTCFENGNIEYWYCDVCGQAWLDEACTLNTNLKSVILPMQHGEIIHVEAMEPTCTELGNIEHWYCADCGYAWLDEACILSTNLKAVILPTREHTYDSDYDPDCNVCGERREGEVPSYLEYVIVDGEVTVTGCEYTMSGDLVIPATIEGYPVTTLKDEVFNSKCVTLTIPATVTDIEVGTYIYSSLTAVYVDVNNPNYSSEDGVLFNKDKTELLWYPMCKPDMAYDIPNSVVIIGKNAFYNNDFVVTITIPDSVTTIQEAAFEWCSVLGAVCIPDSVTSIAPYTFYESGIQSIVLPESITTIGRQSFEGCLRLTEIVIPEGVTTIEGAAFWWCTSLASVTLPISLKTIEVTAFHVCDALTDVYYAGSAMDRAEISIDTNNTPLLNATWHYAEVGCAHEYFYPCDPVCMLCYEITNPDAAHNVIHVAAVEPTCYDNGNVEYWYCDLCGTAWTDDCLMMQTNVLSVILPMAHGSIVQVEAVAPTCYESGNIEYWYCEYCGQAWADEALTLVTNWKNAIIPACHWNIIHVEAKDPTCYEDGNIEYWCCADCGAVWLDEACTMNSNLRAVILSAYHGEIIHVSATVPTCLENGNIEYWYCTDCGQAWLDEWCTMNTNLKAVILSALGHIYDDDYDPDCNYCGEWREVERQYITLDTPAPVTVTVARGTTNYLFVPETSGTYVFYSVGTGDTHGYIYNMDGVCLDADDDGGGNGQFRIVYYMEAGVTYELRGGFFSNHTGSYTVYITHEHTYDNACDADCNICGEWRETAGHSYDDDYDPDCNICGETREVGDLLMGDVDGNGRITMVDLALLQRYLNGWDIDLNLFAADTNGDGKVNVRDLSLLQRYLNGWDVTLG